MAASNKTLRSKRVGGPLGEGIDGWAVCGGDWLTGRDISVERGSRRATVGAAAADQLSLWGGFVLGVSPSGGFELGVGAT